MEINETTPGEEVINIPPDASFIHVEAELQALCGLYQKRR
jgi:hypothetical protein